MFDFLFHPAVPFHFWSGVMFLFGSMVGSFLNVCIHRLPLGQSVVNPGSHCPHCLYSIPWYRNIPLLTWLWLRGRCENCSAPISVRYFVVELITGLAFLAAWLVFGEASPATSVIYSFVLAGFIAATFIDFDHLIIPDEITIGGTVAGFILSFAFPVIHGTTSRPAALGESVLGIAVGFGIVWGILNLGKLMFGKERLDFPEPTKVIFAEEFIRLPDRDLPYEDIFYRRSDTLMLEADRVELPDRCYTGVPVRLAESKLTVGTDEFQPGEVPHMEVITRALVVPREAMGFGDVKFMSAIGAFLGWKAALFSLMASSVIASAVGLTLIAIQRRDWSTRIPFGPYIALAAVLWMFGGKRLVEIWFSR